MQSFHRLVLPEDRMHLSSPHFLYQGWRSRLFEMSDFTCCLVPNRDRLRDFQVLQGVTCCAGSVSIAVMRCTLRSSFVLRVALNREQSVNSQRCRRCCCVRSHALC